jgi:hypothetical protein
MTPTDRDLQDAYQQQTRRPKASRGSCLDASTLASLAAGELEGPARDRAVDHLAECSDCASEFRMLSALGQWSESVAGPLDRKPRIEGQSAWTQFLSAAAMIAAVAFGFAGYYQWQRSEALERDLVSTRRAFGDAMFRSSISRPREVFAEKTHRMVRWSRSQRARRSSTPS